MGFEYVHFQGLLASRAGAQIPRRDCGRGIVQEGLGFGAEGRGLEGVEGTLPVLFFEPPQGHLKIIFEGLAPRVGW
jgi:hypothetical protein